MSRLSARLERLEAQDKPGTVYLWADADADQEERNKMVEAQLRERGLPPDTEATVFRWRS